MLPSTGLAEAIGASLPGAAWQRVAFLLEEGAGFANGVADRGPADVAEGVGEDVQDSEFPLVEVSRTRSLLLIF